MNRRLAALLLAAVAALQACGGGTDNPTSNPNDGAPQTHRLAGALTMPAGARVAMQGSQLHVAAGTEGWQIIDVSLPDAPRRLVTVNTSGPGGALDNTTQVAVSGNLAAVNVVPGCVGTCMADVTDRGELRLYDISAPAAPRLLATLPGAGAVVLDDRTLYLLRPQLSFGPNGSTFARLDVLDVSAPAAPRTLGSTDVAREGEMRRVNRRLLIGVGSAQDTTLSAQAVDISNPVTPQVVASYAVDQATCGGPAPAAMGPRLYVAAPDAALLAFDFNINQALSAPLRVPLSQATRALAAEGGVLYAAQGRALAVFDARSTSAAPTLVQTLPVPEPVASVDAFGSLVVLVTQPVLEPSSVDGFFIVRQPPMLRLVLRRPA